MSETIKKRKWDQADNAEETSVTKVTKVEKDPSKAVSEAAARINAMLAQKGIPLHDEISGLSEIPLSKNEGEFVKDIPINNLKNRYMLTRGATQTQIQQETGADVITRGKYYPDVQLASDKEPPLYLHITASNRESLVKAIAKIEELIETAQVPAPGTGYPPREERPEIKRPERKFHEKRLPVDVGGTPHFNLRAKIVGPNGAFVKHIQQETGSRVQLKGKGSGFYESSTGVESEEPLHVHISCSREEGLEAAVKLTQDLLDTVKAEAERGPPQNQHGYGRGGYSNHGGSRGGYNGHYNNHYNGYQNTSSAQSTASSAVDPAAAQNYDYSAYYNSYYAQQPQAGQQYQYDANAYYSYYGYTPVDPNATAASGAAAPPPPPTASTSPPPPPPASSSPPPPPPPAAEE
ncbi:unnamed protein product [Mucor hiemalis]